MSTPEIPDMQIETIEDAKQAERTMVTADTEAALQRLRLQTEIA